MFRPNGHDSIDAVEQWHSQCSDFVVMMTWLNISLMFRTSDFGDVATHIIDVKGQ